MLFRSPQLSTPERELIIQLDSNLPQQSFAFSQITPGSTWNFQLWFRDTPAGGAGYNLSSALGLTFAP